MKCNEIDLSVFGGRSRYDAPTIKELSWKVEKGFAQSTQIVAADHDDSGETMKMTVTDQNDWWSD